MRKSYSRKFGRNSLPRNGAVAARRNRIARAPAPTRVPATGAATTTVLLTSSCQISPEYDILIRNGTVVDGTGSPGTRADVAISNGAIAAVDELEGAWAKRVLDAAGRIVSPGFIDMMGGSSLPLVTDPPSAESKLRQGIRTMMASITSW